MSQQINLILAELRPKRDWLAFPTMATLSTAGVVLVLVLGGWGRYQVQTLLAEQRQTDAQFQSLQHEIQALGQTLASRRSNPGLQAEIDRMNDSLIQREEALRVLEGGEVGRTAGYASLMRGFSRQVMDGVWLTGFSATGYDVEIRGRLSDPSLLPLYIRRLNEDDVFKGRRFAALDMTNSAAAVTTDSQASVPTLVTVTGYTEFLLRTSVTKLEEKNAR